MCILIVKYYCDYYYYYIIYDAVGRSCNHRKRIIKKKI